MVPIALHAAIMRLMQYGNMAHGREEDWRSGEYAGVIHGHMAGMILCRKGTAECISGEPWNVVY